MKKTLGLLMLLALGLAVVRAVIVWCSFAVDVHMVCQSCSRLFKVVVPLNAGISNLDAVPESLAAQYPKNANHFYSHEPIKDALQGIEHRREQVISNRHPQKEARVFGQSFTDFMVARHAHHSTAPSKLRFSTGQAKKENV